MSATEFYAAGAVQQKEEMFFVVNYRIDVAAADTAIRYNGAFYSITRVDTFEGYKDDLKLYAQKFGASSQPKPGDIQEWQG